MTAEVKLIRPARLPVGHSKLVHVGVNNSEMTGTTCLFEPATRLPGHRGLTMADALVGVGDKGETTLVVANTGVEPVLLEEGDIVSSLQPCTIVQPDDEPASEGAEEMWVSAVRPPTKDDQRVEQLRCALDLDALALSSDDRTRLLSLVTEFAYLFALDDSELGQTSLVAHRIDTGSSLPIKQPPQRVPFALHATVCKMTDDMLARGIITLSSSPSASPIVLVAKRDGSTRFCVDYRRLNAVTKQDVFPLPHIDDSLDLLSGTRYFSSLDLASGYWQVAMDSASKGLYEFAVMPFGLCNAPTTFQRLMEGVLAGLAREKCLIYLDDMLVIGQTFAEHLSHLREVFNRLSSAGLKLKPAVSASARRSFVPGVCGVRWRNHRRSREGESSD